MEFAFRQHSRSIRRNTKKIARFDTIDAQKSCEHGGHENRPAVVRLYGPVERRRIWLFAQVVP
jgi:hypothetical protein